MQKFTCPNISIANMEECNAILHLLNNAYRGETSKKGWTTEANLIAGNFRTNEQSLLQTLLQEGSVFLIYKTQDKITGCVNLQQHGNKIYLGMFAVEPTLQAAGIGKKILLAAEEYAASINCNFIYMTVIAARIELIAWYIRHGYYDTGERKPFIEDAITGKHLQQLEFIVLEKKLFD